MFSAQTGKLFFHSQLYIDTFWRLSNSMQQRHHVFRQIKELHSPKQCSCKCATLTHKPPPVCCDKLQNRHISQPWVHVNSQQLILVSCVKLVYVRDPRTLELPLTSIYNSRVCKYPFVIIQFYFHYQGFLGLNVFFILFRSRVIIVFRKEPSASQDNKLLEQN